MQARRISLPCIWSDCVVLIEIISFCAEDLPFYKLRLVNLNVMWDVYLWSLGNTEIILVTILQI